MVGAREAEDLGRLVVEGGAVEGAVHAQREVVMGAVTAAVVRGAATAVEPLGSEREPAKVLRTDACWSGSPTAASKLRQQVRHHHQSPLPTQRVRECGQQSG